MRDSELRAAVVGQDAVTGWACVLEPEALSELAELPLGVRSRISRPLGGDLGGGDDLTQAAQLALELGLLAGAYPQPLGAAVALSLVRVEPRSQRVAMLAIAATASRSAGTSSSAASTSASLRAIRFRNLLAPPGTLGALALDALEHAPLGP